MEKKIITFTADEQSLRKTGGIPNYASNKVSYIEAQFELGENWQGFDAVRAIWYNKAQTISMVLADGKCIVPYEVLANKGQVMVNLVGSISENDVLTDRLTTYPVVALIVDADAKVDGSNTQPITPSQFEQFVEAVKADAESASESAESASASAESASASAKSAHDDKIEIEQAIAEVIQQIEDFEQVEVVVNTLPAGSQATSDFTDGVLTLGIPQGAKGDTGNGIASCVLNPDYTLTINFTDGTSYTTTSIRGEQGVKGDTGNGISSITKTGSETVDGRVVDTYTTTFTDGETTEFEVTNGKDGEVTMSQLSALLPTDTASGDIASFSDGTDLFSALSVKAQIEPIQDLHGYDKPWSGGAGANQYNPNNQVIPTQAENVNIVNERINATWINGALLLSGKNIQSFPAGTYTMWGEGTNIENIVAWRYTVANNTESQIGSLGAKWTFTTTEPFYIGLSGVSTGGTASFGAMLAKGNVTPTAWTPYSNICPISGHTECVTSISPYEQTEKHTITGENLYNAPDVPNGVLVPCHIADGVTVTASCSGSNATIRYYNASKTQIDYWNLVTIASDGRYYRSFTSSGGIEYVEFTGTQRAQYMVELNTTTPSAYEPYGYSYTTDLGRTVYGGTLDVVSGELTVDRAIKSGVVVDANTGSYTNIVYGRTLKGTDNKDYGTAYNTAISNMYETKLSGASWDSADNIGKMFSGAQTGTYWIGFPVGTTLAEMQSITANNVICYELATPQTYQLTPTEVDLLLGQNNLWTDCGSVEVTYKADIERWVNKKINALI